MLKRIICIVAICLGVLLILLSAAIAMYNIWDENRARESVENVLELVVQAQQAAKNPNSTNKIPSNGSSADPNDKENPPEIDDPSFSQSEDIVPDYVLDPDKDLPSVKINGYKYVGTIHIPVLELELPVLESWSLKLLKCAPCRYLGTPYQENMIICGHNYSSHFGSLKNLQRGDSVYFTDMDGNDFEYIVELVETIPGTGVEQMQSGDWALTLFTCTLNSKSRVTVRCSAVK